MKRNLNEKEKKQTLDVNEFDCKKDTEVQLRKITKRPDQPSFYGWLSSVDSDTRNASDTLNVSDISTVSDTLDVPNEAKKMLILISITP